MQVRWLTAAGRRLLVVSDVSTRLHLATPILPGASRIWETAMHALPNVVTREFVKSQIKFKPLNMSNVALPSGFLVLAHSVTVSGYDCCSNLVLNSGACVLT